jgi:hypothetical protein
MENFDEIKGNEYYIGLCKIDDKQKKIIKKNPHCAEFFCTTNNISNCTTCSNYLIKNKLFNIDPLYIKDDRMLALEKIKKNVNENKCKEKCLNGYLYDFIPRDFEGINRKDNKINKLDKFKNNKNFFKDELIYKYDDIPYYINYEQTRPKPKSVIHWGQLKMFLVILMFLTKVVEPTDKNVHIIYPGSARGDNILILSDMFPNVIWNLIDPTTHHKKLFNHPKVDEIKTEFFTDETAEYFKNKYLKRNKGDKILFMSDIRVDPSDEGIKKDNISDATWHKIINPDYSYLKFRCPYEGEKEYKFYDGKIYIQPFAPVGSTESRLFCSNKLEPKIYNIDEYQGKFFYFNRVLRPAYYNQSLIEENDYFDHCYDCTYFSHLIKNYLKKFPNNIFDKEPSILHIMNKIKDRLLESTMDRIKLSNQHIKHGIK